MTHPRHLLTILILLFYSTASSQEVIFSTNGGFYEEPFELTLSCWSYDKVIHFTTNGNIPTVEDPIYSNPLLLNQNLYSKSDIFTIRTSPEDLWFVPKTVQKCIVIRAAAFDAEGHRVGEVATNSYFIASLGCDTHGLPVISLCADSLDLFDYEQGILVPGIHYNTENHDYSGNYYQTGRDWERCCNVEFYETDNNGINQQAGVRVQGNSTRRYPQKGLKIYAREEYGKKRFNYKFFEDTEIERFKHLKIKSFKGSWTGAGCQDHFCERLARNLDIDCLSSRPVVLFINGEYWGIYYLQEKPDERYIEDHYDFDLDDINIVDSWDGTNSEYGSGEALTELFEWLEQHDLSDDDNYQYVKERIDISNFMDYEIFQIFSANRDWPSNNLRCWQADNSLWRFIFFDGDACLTRSMSDFDAFANAIYDGEDLYPASKTSTLLFRRLMENDTFKLAFLHRFDHLLSTTFNYHSTKEYYDETYNSIINEIPNQINRFGNPESMGVWKKRMRSIDKFLSQRVDDINDMLHRYYLSDMYGITISYLSILPTNNGIQVGVEAKEVGLTDIQIYDNIGRRYYYSTFVFEEGLNEVTLSAHLNTGIYILRVGNQSKKFIILN